MSGEKVEKIRLAALKSADDQLQDHLRRLDAARSRHQNSGNEVDKAEIWREVVTLAESIRQRVMRLKINHYWETD